jgi:hypothetical protein
MVAGWVAAPQLLIVYAMGFVLSSLKQTRWLGGQLTSQGVPPGQLQIMRERVAVDSDTQADRVSAIEVKFARTGESTSST